ncbi:hypothetical protein DRE_04533 [Drechslerella stenobrocha 248]|uniref:RING-type domain-containing protein n=1 Tax=Drechslerella stenobrocha 248 TaxID=1043628 RepID=W7IAQ4_9PEZI|nr:hypothetical protein DRE_04533 [Drechslerella stenobrocha 248]
MDFPTRPIPSSSSLFTNSAAVKPSTSAAATVAASIGQPSLQPQATASASTSLKRASTEPADILNASSSTMPALRSRSNKVAKNSQTSGEKNATTALLKNGDAKSPVTPVPLYDPRDDQIKDLQSDLTKLQKCVTCVVCQDLLFEPYSLGCGHVFCYSCLKDWFRQKRTCPECRARVKTQPAPAYLIRNMIDIFVTRTELQSPHEDGQAFRKQQAEALEMVNADKADPKGLFSGVFTRRTANAIYDPEDGVARCPECNWEIEDRVCASCGRQFHPSELPGGDSDASDASEFSDGDSELDEGEDDDSLSASDRSDAETEDLHTDAYGESDNGVWEVDYDEDHRLALALQDEDHRLALALQDEYHQEFMRRLGVSPNWVEEHFGADRAEAAREAARDYLQRSISRGRSSSGRSLQQGSSPFSRDSDEDSRDNTVDEDDSEMDDFIVHDTPERRPRSHQTAQRTLRRNARRSVADLSDDEEEEEEDEDEDEEPVIARRNTRPSYYERRSIISSDNEEEAGLIVNDGYAQLEHDTTTGDDDDDDDSVGMSDIGQALRPAGPLRASTMPVTTSISTRQSLREQAAASQRRSATPPVPRRRRRTVTFQVPEDADGENDSDTRDEDGDLDMDRHSRAGSTSLASTSSNQTDVSTRQTHSGGNRFSQDTSVNEDESSDDSMPVQRSGRRRLGGNTLPSSSNLRRPTASHSNARNGDNDNRPSNSVDPMVHRLLRNFSAQRNESQLEQLGMSTGQPASLDLQELNEPIVISSSPVQTFLPGGNSNRQTHSAANSTREGSVFSTLSSSSVSRDQNNALGIASPATRALSPPAQQMVASISQVSSDPNAWEMAAAPATSAVPSAGQNNSTNRGSIRTRRSNATLRGADIQRSGTPTTRQATRATRNQTQTAAEREDIRHRARDLVARRQRDLAERSTGGAQAQASTTGTRAARGAPAAGTAAALSLQQRLASRAEANTNGRDSATPTPSTSQAQEGGGDSAPPTRGIARTDTGGSSTGRRRGYQIGTGNNPGPLFVISDDDQ